MSEPRAHSVTRSTFADVAADLEAALPDAAFVAIDFEMSGIGAWRQNKEDTAQDRYTTMRATVDKYTIVQFGVAVFTEVQPGQYESRPYNFFTFPSGLSGRDVTLSSSAIRFLADNGMDFQSWLAEGIPYVTATRTQTLRDNILTPPAPKPRDTSSKVQLTWDSDKAFVAEALPRFETWLTQTTSPKNMKNASNDVSEFVFPPCNAWLRRAIYQEVEALVDACGATGVEKEARKMDSGEWAVVVMYLTPAQQAEREETKAQERQAKFDAAVGVTRVFNALVDAKKPLVGHNCLYDLMFMLHNFDDPLPETYNAFTARVHYLFPNVCDTKHLAATGSVAPSRVPGRRYEATALGALYKHIIAPSVGGVDTRADATTATGCSVTLPDVDMFEHYRQGDGEAFHEAGWDAHCTGVVFAHLVPDYVVDATGTVAGHGIKGIEAVCHAAGNWLHGTGTVLRWNLKGEPATQAILDEGATLYITGLTSDDKTPHIDRIFQGGLLDGEIRHEVQWVSGSSAFVSVYPKQGVVIDSNHLLREVHARMATGERPLSATVQVHPWEDFCAGVSRPLDPIAELPDPVGTWGKVKHAWHNIAWMFRRDDEASANGDAGGAVTATGRSVTRTASTSDVTPASKRPRSS
eukprot:m.84309 g.84309  ORF g.84309 m.84309 type:complete len:635 (-) comp9591_c1_seq3:2059-3963(-)